MEKQNYLYKNPSHAGNMNRMRLTGQLCDVTIKVEDKSIQAHRVILAANLKYFESMFLNSFQEHQKDVITMENVDSSGLETFINYAYTGEILLTNSNALGLLEIADYLNESCIKESCIDFLVKNLKMEHAIRAYKFANAIECLQLKNAAISRIQTNFTKCSQTGEYLDMNFESVEDLLIDIKSNASEFDQMFFEGIMYWIMHALKERRVHLSELLNSINIKKLGTDYLVKYVGSIASLDDDCGIIKDIMLTYHNKKVENKKQELLFIIGNFGDELHSQFYDFTENKWSSRDRISDDDNDNKTRIHSSAVLNNKIYYMSEGSEGFLRLNVFDPSNRRSTSVDYFFRNSFRCGAIAACSKFIYLCDAAFGNYTFTSLKFIKYDPITNFFEMLTPERYEVSQAAAIFYQGCLHVLGGRYPSFPQKLVAKYDPTTDNWTEFPSMNETRFSHAVAVLDGKLYACGGGSSNTAEVYDPAKNSWQYIPTMSRERNCFLLIAHEGKLLAIGGDEDNTVEVYDPSKDQWQIYREMSSGLQIRHPMGGIDLSN